MAKEPAAKEVRTTPYVVAGTKDPSKLYVSISHTSEKTREVVKGLEGSKFMGGDVNKWEVNKDAYTAALPKIDAAYAEDNAARAAASAAKPAKEPKAPKAELTEEQKAERAAARLEARNEADKTRVPVVVGSVAEGAEVADGAVVTGLGKAWKLEDEAAVEALAARFPDVKGLKVGAEVQFANFEVKEPVAEPGM